MRISDWSSDVCSSDLVVTIITDRVIFDPGSDVLTADGQSVIGAISDAIAPLPNKLSIEGHTASVPIASAGFPSNWELSTARATSVLRALIERHTLAPGRLSDHAKADQRPLARPDTPEGRAPHRRVESVVTQTRPTWRETCQGQK